MKLIINKCNISYILKVLVVISLIFASGANFMIRSIYFFVLCSCLYWIYRKKLNKRYLLISSILIIYIFFDSCVINTAPSDYKECILLSLRVICCAVVASNVTIKEFKEIFLKIMEVLSVLSLVSFAIFLVFGTLPGIHYIDGWIGTFYHTIGYGNINEGVHRMRNCGIFMEPGIFQMYLNMALLSLSTVEDISLDKAHRMFWLFSITLISTLSSMGYILFILVLIIFFIENRNLLPRFLKVNIKGRVFIVVLLGVSLLFFELWSGVVTGIITSANSWASRHDDTLLTFLIARDYPIWGLGLATDMEDIWFNYYYKYENVRLYTAYQNARSCGLGNYMALGGIPFASIYMISIIKTYFRMYNFKALLSKILLSIILVLFVLEEPLLSTPIFLITFFYCIKRKDNISNVLNERVLRYAK